MVQPEQPQWTEEGTRLVAAMVGLPLDSGEVPRLTAEVAGIFGFLSELWQEDLGETEPAVLFVPGEDE